MNTMVSSSSADNDAIAAMVGGGDVDLVESSSGETTEGLRTPTREESLDLRPVPMTDRVQGKDRSTEKVMVKARRIKKVEGVPGVGTDDTESMDRQFAADIKNKVALLEFLCYNTLHKKNVRYLGQAAILRHPETKIVKFVTCKHNLATDLNDDGVLEHCRMPHHCFLANQTEAMINIPNTGWRKVFHHAISLRDGITWSHGFDIALGPVVNAQTARDNWPNGRMEADVLDSMFETLKPFDLVDESFSYEEGLKIGIAVYSPGAGEEAFSEAGGLRGNNVLRNWANIVKGLVAAAIAAVCGEKDDVMIYTGKITKNCTDHIEYNANSYKGCSGAIVIVMDRRHADFGKAIAVHGGYNAELGTNLGFKLAGNFDRPW